MGEVALAGRLPEPVGYSGGWLALAVALPVVVVLYYAAVTWLTRRRATPGEPAPTLGVLRDEHLALLDGVEEGVRAGSLSARQAHQELSRVVRSFVSAAGPVDVLTLPLADLRARAPREVADLVALVYPPAFAPGDEGRPRERLDPALRDARTVVSTWTP